MAASSPERHTASGPKRRCTHGYLTGAGQCLRPRATRSVCYRHEHSVNIGRSTTVNPSPPVNLYSNGCAPSDCPHHEHGAARGQRHGQLAAGEPQAALGHRRSSEQRRHLRSHPGSECLAQPGSLPTSLLYTPTPDNGSSHTHPERTACVPASTHRVKLHARRTAQLVTDMLGKRRASSTMLNRKATSP